MANKEKAAALIESIETGNPGPAEYINPDKYIQNTLAVGDGLAGFADVMKQLPEGSACAKVVRMYDKNHMVLGEVNFVLAVSEGQFLGRHVAFYDLFRTESQKMIEKFDIIEEIPTEDMWKNSNGKF